MKRLERFRNHKDEFFRTHDTSPLQPEQRKNFTGLRYYPENPDLQFEVALNRDAGSREPVELKTTQGETMRFIPAGTIGVAIEGQSVELMVYREPGRGRFFLPFRDATSGSETYELGRYLDPQETPKGTLIVDFNYAYNPYCAYNDQWSCPLPPAENIVSTPVRAGEKRFP